MYTKDKPLTFAEEQFYLTEGTLTELQVSPTKVNLLEQIDQHVKSRSLISGAAAAASDLYGIAANSTAITLYDGEDTFHFAAMLDEKLICGTFQHADKLREGDRVKVVLSRRENILFAHAIMNSRNEFYMPLNVFSSADGMLRYCMRVAFNFTLFLWVLLFLIFFFLGTFTAHDIKFDDKLLLVLMIVVGPPMFMFPFEYWTYRTMSRGGKDPAVSYAEAIFKVLGFRNPSKIDLLADSKLSSGENGGWYAAWQADKLLAKNG